MATVTIYQVFALFIILPAGHCFLVSTPRTVVKVLGPTYRGIWGDWGPPQFCAQGSFAVGYDMKIEGKQGHGDDTALNAIKLVCQSLDGHHFGGTITSTVGQWGGWWGEVKCNYGYYLKEFALQVERDQHHDDDTTANYVKFKCQDFASTQNSYELAIPPGHGFWGEMGMWSESCPPNSAICGIKTRVERDQHHGDDTTLNDVEFYCCHDDSWNYVKIKCRFC